MSAGLSSRRIAPAFAPSLLDSKGLSILTFIAGIIAMCAGALFEVGILAAIGFVGVVLPVVVWNANFWADAIKDRKFHSEYRIF